MLWSLLRIVLYGVCPIWGRAAKENIVRNVQKIAAVAVATCGILFAGIGGASADTKNDHKGDNIPVLSYINELDWDESPFCGIQIKTEDSKQKTSCPVVHQEHPHDSPVYIITF
ncbi:hypothetical protein [Streptomyces sp. NPDC056061]|uniref:hypothetical protein n=1 Tax=Streptomyces sp. NPDC056061 TaxID=3345700 RepID=UPI0035DDB614